MQNWMGLLIAAICKPGRLFALASAVAMLVAALGAPAGPADAATVTSASGTMYGVSALSATNAWAVGCKPNASSGAACPGTGANASYHWNGTSWNAVSVPQPSTPTGADDGHLLGVKAVSSTNVWAVGRTDTDGAEITQWNGTKWSLVSVPAVPTWGKAYNLNSIAGTSASDLWAVGETDGQQTVILHYNGTAWKQISSPNPTGTSDLYGVAATSTSNAWAVGDNFNQQDQAMVLHWNGTAWKVVFDGLPGTQSVLNSVTPVSATSAWAGGYTRNTVNFTLTMTGNGSTWKRVTTGQGIGGSASSTFIFATAASSTKDVWAAGSSSAAPMLHWNGTTWKKVSLPVFGGTGGLQELLGMTSLSATNAWAVGYYSDAPVRIAILHWNGTAWIRT